MKLPRLPSLPALGSVLIFTFTPVLVQAGDSPLEKSMENMEDIKKELFPAMKAPVAADKDQYIKLAKALKAEGEISKSEIPEIAKKLPAAEKDAMVAAYSKDMDVFIATTQSLIEALEKDQLEQAQGWVAKLKEQEKSGHKAFRPKKEKTAGAKPAEAPAK